MESKQSSRKRAWESSSSEPKLTPPTAAAATVSKEEIESQMSEAMSRCDRNLCVNFINPLYRLIREGVIDGPDNLLRAGESFKQSWDCGLRLSLCYKAVYSDCTDYSPAMEEGIDAYQKIAIEGHYFDVPHPNDRMEIMYRGFFVIYPEDSEREQEDPIFEEQPNLKKAIPLISELGKAAVEYHNFMTDSKLRIKKTIKANLFFKNTFQLYFITLTAIDGLSGEEVTCQSRVKCYVLGNCGWPRMAEGPTMAVETTYVESFRIVRRG